jgi:hypothetical protein
VDSSSDWSDESYEVIEDEDDIIDSQMEDGSGSSEVSLKKDEVEEVPNEHV